MNKTIKTMLCALLCSALFAGSVVALAACGENEEPPQNVCTEHVDSDQDGKCDVCGEDVPVQGGEEQADPDDLNTGYFGTNLNGQKDVFIHLYPNGYCFLSSASINGILRYEVKEETVEVPTSEDGSTPAQSCEKTLIVYNEDGSVHATFGYHDGKLYTGSYLFYLAYEWEGTEPKPSYVESTTFRSYREVGGSKFNSFNLGVDGTFSDELADETVTGTWEAGENSYIFYVDGAKYAELVMASETSAALTYADGSEKQLYTGDGEVAVVTLKGTIDASVVGFEMAVTLSINTDGSAKLSYGMEVDGTAEKTDTGYTVEINGVEFAVTETDGAYTADLPLAVIDERMGELTVTLSGGSEVSEKVVMTGSDSSLGIEIAVTLTIDGGTARVEADVFGQSQAVDGTAAETETGYLVDFNGTEVTVTLIDGVYTAQMPLSVISPNLASITVALASAAE